jgi:hypothetical protein
MTETWVDRMIRVEIRGPSLSLDVVPEGFIHSLEEARSTRHEESHATICVREVSVMVLMLVVDPQHHHGEALMLVVQQGTTNHVTIGIHIAVN